MKRKLLPAAAAFALAAAAVVGVPAAAHAYPEDAPGASVPVTFPASDLEPGTASVLLSGENASAATVAVVLAAYEANQNIGSTTIASNGSASFSVVLPANASGSYTTTIVDSTGQSASVSFAAGSTGAGGGGSALPSTGFDSNSLLGLWVGGGALVLAGGAVAVAAAVQRQRRNADAA